MELSHHANFIGLAYQGKDIVFRFIIKYSSLRDFGHYIIGPFLYEDFWKMIFWLVLKLEISYYWVIISWRILVSFLEDFFLKIIFLHGEIFEFSEFFFCLQILYNVNGKGTVWHTPCSFGVLNFFILICCLCLDAPCKAQELP
jgi:hypothetical protein